MLFFLCVSVPLWQFQDLRNRRGALQSFIDRDLIKRRNRKRLGLWIARSQQMKLRHLIRQGSQLEQLVSDRGRVAKFLTVVAKAFDCTADRRNLTCKIALWRDRMLHRDGLAFVLQKRIAQL